MVEYEAFFLALITSLISFSLGFVSAYLRDWIKQSKENRKMKEVFLKIFEGFCSINNTKRAHLSVLINLLNIDIKILTSKLEMLVGIEYSPERKSISRRTTGGFNEYKFKDENDSQFPFEQEILRRFSLNTNSTEDFYVMNQKIDSITIRMEDENWFLIIGLFPFMIWENKDSNLKFDYRDVKNSNPDVLINFLKTLESKYKKAKIIKKSKSLVNDVLIAEIMKIKEKNKED
jgi:hypothetical protein